MKNRCFTFLYIPSENKAPRMIRIPRLLIYSLIVTFGVGLGASTWAIMRYADKVHEVYKLSSLEKENEILRERVETFSRDLGELRKQVAQNFDFQKKARLLANLDELNEDITEVGVGGPEFAYVRSIPLLDDNLRDKVKEIGGEIGKVVRQARLQEKSYSEIIEALSEGEKSRRATPSVKPVPHGFVSSRFGRRMDPFTGRIMMHRGVDYSVRMGTPIFATADGVVTHAGRWSSFGMVVEISHGYGLVTRYAHASKILVKKGQRVKRGDIIARVGATGKATAAHLHYEVLKNNVHVNPLAYVIPDTK